jgi:hypothetical protein
MRVLSRGRAGVFAIRAALELTFVSRMRPTGGPLQVRSCRRRRQTAVAKLPVNKVCTTAHEYTLLEFRSFIGAVHVRNAQHATRNMQHATRLHESKA